MPLKLDRIHNLDCIKGMAELEAGSVDLAFADPPFNIGYTYDVYDDRRGADEYLAWSKRWIEGVIRVLKPTGAFWLAIGDEFAAELKVLATRDLGLHCRSWVVWFYTFGVHCKSKFTRSHVHLFHFVKDARKFTFNSLAVRVPSARELVYGDSRADPNGRVPDDTWMMSPVMPPEVATKDGFILRPQDIPERFPADSDTWFYSRVAGTFNERQGFHGCQMPEQILGRIIRACSNEGETVLDPFGGSGTTPAVAKKLSRRFVAFELSEDYTRQVNKRLASIEIGDDLIGPVDAARSAPKTKVGRRLNRVGRSTTALDSPRSAAPRTNGQGRRTKNGEIGIHGVVDAEIQVAVADAFKAAHQGFSADRLLADPSLNEEFLDHCRQRGIPGTPKDWNHFLLNTRKAGGLAAIDTPQKTNVKRIAMEPFVFASEIAWQHVSQKRHCTLDEILCDPAWTSEFDLIASRIAPGYSPFDYRWAALALRKDSKRSVHDSVLQRLRGQEWRFAIRKRPDDEVGYYRISAGDTMFYVGMSNSLRSCPFLEPQRIETAMEVTKATECRLSEICVRFQYFDPNALATLQKDAKPADGPLKFAVRAILLDRYRPVANVLPAAVRRHDATAA